MGFVDRLIRWAGALSVLCLCGMVLVLAATLVLRPFGILVPSSEIIATFLMVGMALFGFVYAYAERVHIRVDTLHRRIPAVPRRWIEIISHFGAAALCAFITYHSAGIVWLAYRFNDLSDGLIAIPMWIPLGAMPVGFGLLTLALLRDAVRLLRGQAVRFGTSEKDDAVALASKGQGDTP